MDGKWKILDLGGQDNVHQSQAIAEIVDWQLHVVPGTWTFVFFMATVDFTDEKELLSRRMTKYWSNFTRHGREDTPPESPRPSSYL